MDGNKLNKILAAAQTVKGSPELSIDELSECLDEIYQNNMFIQTMEAFGSDGSQPNYPVQTYLSILGLDLELNWEKHQDPALSRQLVENKIDTAVRTKLDMNLSFGLMK